MADTSAYFKLAASNIRNVIQVKRQDIDNLRRELDNAQREVSQHTNDRQAEIRFHEAQMAESDKSKDMQQAQMERAEKMRIISDVHTKMVDKQHELNRIREQITAQIQAVEREIQDLERLASGLMVRT